MVYEKLSPCKQRKIDSRVDFIYHIVNSPLEKTITAIVVCLKLIADCLNRISILIK